MKYMRPGKNTELQNFSLIENYSPDLFFHASWTSCISKKLTLTYTYSLI